MLGFEFNNGTVLLITAVVGAIVWYWWKNQQYYKTYWEKRGVFTPPVAGTWTLIKLLYEGKIFKIARENYEKYGKLYGFFDKSTPMLSVGDPDLLKDILVKDFNVFHFRRDLKQGDPISDNMVSILKGEHWKRVRTIITPAFTSKRMRLMSSIIDECSKSVLAVCEDHYSKGKPIECKGLFGSYVMDVIARAAFGTKIDSVSDPNNPFVTAAKNTFLPTNILRMLIFVLTPQWLLKTFRFSSLEDTNFFRDVTLQVIKKRKETGKSYNDVLQILMDAAEEDAGNNVADLEDETDRYGSIITDEQKTSVKYKCLSEDEVLAQSTLFFSVGYETTASTLTFLCYCLAINPEWQDKVIEEVDEAFKKHSEMSYDAVRDMKVLDAVMSETLRMYPILPSTERTADQDYELGSSRIRLEKGTRILIPIYGLHYDEQYFPDPNSFNPNRFLDATADELNRMQYTYLPFGAGPRNCLGMRFALMEIKLIMANILRHFRLRRHETTKVPLEFKLGSFFLAVTDLPLKLEKRSDVPT